MEDDQGEELVTFDMMPANINSDLLLGEVPKLKDRILEREMEKLDYNGHWQARRVILTSKRVLLTRPGEDSLVDSIPLVEIERVVPIKNPAEFSPSMSARTDSIGSRIRSTGFNVVLGDETRFKFSIFTDEKGYNSGVTYTMSVSDENQCLEMVKEIEALRSIERARIERVNDGSRVKWAQRAVRRCYATRLVQWGFAALIFANFVLNVAQTELQPADGSALQGAFERCDTAFTFVFLFEVAVNMFANWFWPFVKVPSKHATSGRSEMLYML